MNLTLVKQLQTILDHKILIDLFKHLLHCLQTNLRIPRVIIALFIENNLIMWHVIENLKEHHVTQFPCPVVDDIVVYDVYLLILEKEGELGGKFFSDALAEGRGDLYDRVGEFLEGFLVEVLEIVQDRLCGAACACARLYDVYPVCCSALLLVHFVGLANVVGDCHAVVRLEDFARGEPCIFGVLFDQLSLVIVEPDQLLEIYWRF